MVIPATRLLGAHQGIHETKIGEGIAAINHLTAIDGAAISVHKTRGEGCTAENYGHMNADLIEGFKIVLHEGR